MDRVPGDFSEFIDIKMSEARVPVVDRIVFQEISISILRALILSHLKHFKSRPINVFLLLFLVVAFL